jgi:hypothetical protein
MVNEANGRKVRSRQRHSAKGYGGRIKALETKQ